MVRGNVPVDQVQEEEKCLMFPRAGEEKHPITGQFLMLRFIVSRGQFWTTALRRKRREGTPSTKRFTAMDLNAFVILNS